MITQNKLSGQPNGKVIGKFDSSFERNNLEHKSKGSKKKIAAILMVIFIIVACAVLGLFVLINKAGNSNEPASEIPPIEENTDNNSVVPADLSTIEETDVMDDGAASIQPITSAKSSNPTISLGRLMLINPNFMVEADFIAARKNELISLTTTYGILEFHAHNGDNLLDPEAAEYLNEMLSDYAMANPGHSIKTVSCFRSVGTSCGRLCMPTGASDHHTGLTCDLIDPSYGDSLDTSTYDQHLEWQWLRNNSYKYGFIDRFPEAWAGGPMSEPMNIDANGSTGLYETWHYRYVGKYAAEEIATGLYNNGEYDSLEHYLLARNLVTDLTNSAR